METVEFLENQAWRCKTRPRAISEVDTERGDYPLTWGTQNLIFWNCCRAKSLGGAPLLDPNAWFRDDPITGSVDDGCAPVIGDIADKKPSKGL